MAESSSVNQSYLFKNDVNSILNFIFFKYSIRIENKLRFHVVKKTRTGALNILTFLRFVCVCVGCRYTDFIIRLHSICFRTFKFFAGNSYFELKFKYTATFFVLNSAFMDCEKRAKNTSFVQKKLTSKLL